MSGYNGRRAPNFSQYIEDLNAIPSPYDQALQQQQQRQETFNLDAELSLFTNTEFFDFDSFGDLNLPAFDSVKEDALKTEQQNNGGQTAHNPDLEFLNLLGDGFGNMPDFSAPNLNSVNSQPAPIHNTQFPELPTISTALPSAPYNVKPSPTQTTSSATSPSVPASSPIAAATPASAVAAAPKRKNTQKTPVLSVEEVSRMAAEEDKRRRNTAASARFRVKKKLREQALEKTVKETNDKNAALEARVTALELENQWLKNLITEKNGKTSEETKKSENDIANMFKKFLASQHPDAQRSLHESKIGVGTA